MKTGRFDIHQHITDKIVSAIERGAGDFRLPWHRATGSILRPVNIASKKAYRGVNVVARLKRRPLTRTNLTGTGPHLSQFI